MRGNIIGFLLLVVPLVACADPRYAEAGPGPKRQKPLAECQAAFSAGACVELTWEKYPTQGEFGAFVVRIFQPGLDGAPPVLVEPDGDLAVVLWMPSMGHGSSPVSLVRLESGIYRASNVFFSMHGEWEIRFLLKRNNEVVDQAVIPIRF